MKLKLITFLFILCSYNFSFAGEGNGVITIAHVGHWNNKDLMFFHTPNRTGVPACATEQNRWVVDLTTQLGRSQYSFLLAAQMAGKEIVVAGTGDCSLYSNSETARWVGFPLPGS